MSFKVDNVFWLGWESEVLAEIMNQDNETTVKEMINTDNSPMNNFIILYFNSTLSSKLSPLILP